MENLWVHATVTDGVTNAYVFEAIQMELTLFVHAVKQGCVMNDILFDNPTIYYLLNTYEWLFYIMGNIITIGILSALYKKYNKNGLLILICAYIFSLIHSVLGLWSVFYADHVYVLLRKGIYILVVSFYLFGITMCIGYVRKILKGSVR